MSRFDDDGESDYNNSDLWYANLDRHLKGKRGKQALLDFKAALEALPEKRLIEDALQKNGEVCALGAYLWHQKVKAGMDPTEAFGSLPEMSGEHGTPSYETVDYAAAHGGLTRVLAWELGYPNDETWSGLTPEERYEKFMGWIDQELARPPDPPRPPKPPPQPGRMRLGVLQLPGLDGNPVTWKRGQDGQMHRMRA